MRTRWYSAMPVLVVVSVVGWTAAPAQAQWVITPQLAGNVAGDVEFRRGGPGVSGGYLGRRLGFEFEFQRYQHFFKDSEIVPLDPAAPPNCTPAVGAMPCTDINTDAMGFMGNVMVPFHRREAKWLPYATAGLGLIRAWTNEKDRHQNDVGFNVGAGLIYSAGARVGLRGDLRYSRGFADPNARGGVYFKDYGFWRVTFGVAFTLP
jgi:opacity protein-like surface antigen